MASKQQKNAAEEIIKPRYLKIARKHKREKNRGDAQKQVSAPFLRYRHDRDMAMNFPNILKKFAAKRNYYNNPKKCAICTMPIEYDMRINATCGKKCAKLWLKITRTDKTPRPIKTCLNCPELILSTHRDRAKYCSYRCHIEHKWKMQVKNIKETGNCGSVSTARKFLITERGHQCENCRRKKFRGVPIVIEMHHINGNRRDNTLKNIRLLCVDCHAQTDNFRGKYYQWERHQHHEAARKKKVT